MLAVSNPAVRSCRKFCRPAANSAARCRLQCLDNLPLYLNGPAAWPRTGAGAAATATGLVSGEQLRREVHRQEQAEECNQAAKYEFHQVSLWGRMPQILCTASLCTWLGLFLVTGGNEGTGSSSIFVIFC
jgi:hypothetical protein